MEVPLISEFINNVGFPIAVTVALFYQMNKTQETYMKTLEEFRKIIQTNTEELKLLNNNVEKLKRTTIELAYKNGKGVNDDV